MDPLTAIGLASNVISFIDFAGKLISQGYEIYESTSGTSQDNLDIDILVTDLSFYIDRLKQPGLKIVTAVTQREHQLEILGSKCAELAGEIKQKLIKLRVSEETRFRGLKSIGKALRTAWGKNAMKEKKARLDSFRSELQFGILLHLKENNDLAEMQQSENFKRQEEGTKQLVKMLLEGQDVFTRSLAQSFQKTETNIKKYIDDHKAQELVTQQKQEDDRKEEIVLQHLRFPTIDIRYEQVDPAHAKTFEWIFGGFDSKNGNGFVDWIEGKTKDENLFWIYGKAGSGKSTLMKFIYDDPRTKERLLSWAGDKTLTVASFFFWISGNADQCSQTGLLRSLLHHLLLQHRHLIRVVFPDLWKVLDISTILRAWSLPYASKALKTLLSHDLGRVVLFIDGLDEYHGDHGNHLSSTRPENFKEIVDLINSLALQNVKICFSSRSIPIFHNKFNGRPKLRLQDLTYNDIYTYVKDKLEDDLVTVSQRPPHNVESFRFISQIAEKAEGVFLWAVLVVKSLLTGIENYDDFEKLNQLLELAPSGILDLYSQMLERIQPHHLAEGCMMFSIFDTALTTHEKLYQHTISVGYYNVDLCMLGLWFALEHSELGTSRVNRTQILLTDAEIVKAILQIDRKLKTRCAGLLETGSTANGIMLAEPRLGNRRIEYLHRTTKEFLDLAKTRSSLRYSVDSSYDPKLSLLWSAIQLIRIYKPGSIELAGIEDEQGYLLDLANSALLLAQDLQREGRVCLVELLDLLDSTMQRHYSEERRVSWTKSAMGSLIYNHFDRLPWEFNTIAAQMSDSADFLSLAIFYGFEDYLEAKIVEGKSLSILEKKKGIPYLDYAFLCYTTPPWVMPKMVRLLLRAGASPNEHWPSVDTRELLQSLRRKGPNAYTAWTPWISALQCVLGSKRLWRTNWKASSLHAQQRHDWILVFRYLLAEDPDVSVIVWPTEKSKTTQSYTVSEVIELVFAKENPEEAKELLLMVEKLALAQGCMTNRQGHQEMVEES